MNKSQPILVIGAGLCGLVTALALHKLGFRVRVAEQAPQLGEVGAGLTLSRGTMRCLDWLGLVERVIERSELTTNYPFLHYRTGALLRAESASRPAESEPQWRSRQLHRADLHALLVTALRATGSEILLDHRLTGIVEKQGIVTATFANGASIDAPLLIGSDGVRSAVRDQVLPQRGHASFTGHVAFRCLVPGSAAQPFMSAGRGAVYLGPGHTINRYSLRDGAIINCVGLAGNSSWRGEGWNTPASNEEFLSHFTDWHADVVGLIRAAPASGIIKWALFGHEPAAGWSAGRIVLAGDAAHPMLPYLGLGAAMAIEDGVILAQAIHAFPDITEALQTYEALRLPRCTQIYTLSKLQGELSQRLDPDNYAAAKAPAHDASLFDFNPLLMAEAH